MTEAGKKPRDIKNLKARLGRTVTPATPGANVPPGTPGALPPSQPQPGQPAQPGRPAGGPPLGQPPASGGGLPPPAVRAPGAGGPPGVQQRPGAGGAAAPAEPFGSPQAQPVEEKKVKLVIDDSAVSDTEIGRKGRGRLFIVLGLGVVVGLVLGFGVGSTSGSRARYNLAVEDGKEIYKVVQEASKTVSEAQQLLTAATKAAAGGPGQPAQVDYESIRALQGLEQPMTAGDFTRKRYRLLKTSTADDLFDYYNGIVMAWDKIPTVAAKTLSEKRREALNKAAKATDHMLNSQYGLVPFESEESIGGGLVYVSVPQGKQGEEGPKTVQVSSVVGGRTVEKIPFMGQPAFAEKPTNFVILVDKRRSKAILSQSSSLFNEYLGDIMELKRLIDKTAEVQGRLIKELGKVASLETTLF